jgi:hypothetical protein
MASRRVPRMGVHQSALLTYPAGQLPTFLTGSGSAIAAIVEARRMRTPPSGGAIRRLARSRHSRKLTNGAGGPLLRQDTLGHAPSIAERRGARKSLRQCAGRPRPMPIAETDQRMRENASIREEATTAHQGDSFPVSDRRP